MGRNFSTGATWLRGIVLECEGKTAVKMMAGFSGATWIMSLPVKYQWRRGENMNWLHQFCLLSVTH